MKNRLTIPQQIMQEKTRLAASRLKAIVERQQSIKRRVAFLDYRIRFILDEIRKIKVKWGVN
ncbi:hypothetical protein M0L20_13790 [Spirosoma sp. RP8]|uniref:Uncharacterized protein n=1 Tax=Spirosoma liriopis TaxID=2937440 RepID=A0ABT0HL80_9BACT|nr:hypothetical protein [Spirosoma liriopis]MCK8492934.1 hypothetical protein [Spirosoma liriopis]